MSRGEKFDFLFSLVIILNKGRRTKKFSLAIEISAHMESLATSSLMRIMREAIDISINSDSVYI